MRTDGYDDWETEVHKAAMTYRAASVQDAPEAFELLLAAARKPAAPKNPQDAPKVWRGDSNAALAWACGWNECLEASKPAAPALCTICKGYGRYQDGDSGTESDGYAPNIVECDCAPEERHPAAPSLDESGVPEYTRGYADGLAFGLAHARAEHARAASTSANVATLYQYRTKPTWTGGRWCEWTNCSAEAAADYRRVPLLHDWSYEVRELFERATPPAQTALTDDARDAARWRRVQHQYSANEIDALTAAQSASGDTK